MIIIASSFQNPSNTIPILFLHSNKGDTSIVVRYLSGICSVLVRLITTQIVYECCASTAYIMDII